MRNLFIISLYTILETIKKKAFIVSNIIMFIVILFIFIIIGSILSSNSVNRTINSDTQIEQTYNTVNSIEVNSTQSHDILPVENSISEDLQESNKILIVDKENLFIDYIKYLNDLNYFFIVDNNLNEDDIKLKLNNEDFYSAVILKSESGQVNFKYLIKNNSRYAENEIKTIINLLKTLQITKLLDEANIPEDELLKLNTPIEYNIEVIDKDNSFNSMIIIGMVVSMLLFFAIYLYGHNIASSITNEKTSRIIETLVTSSSPTNIVIGKTLGMGILGLLQLIALIIFSIICYKALIPSNLQIVDVFMKSINISTSSILLLFVYFLLGYILYAFSNAIVGASVSKAEDVQSANVPLSLISLASFYLAFFTISIPDNDLSKFANMFPFSAVFSMPGKILTNQVNPTEIGVSLMILFFTTLILTFISIRIYSVAILHYGNRLKIKDLFNLFIRFK